MNYSPIFLFLFLIASCSIENKENKNSEKTKNTSSKEQQVAIMKEHLVNGAWKHRLYSIERQEEIDKGLKKDSTIAYLWQQKAMPLFKQGKYELGMEFIDKAVEYDRERWQEYRAFIKCIFAKTYKDAIIDFEDCKKRFGNNYVMDHSYNFYIALSKIQLNQFEEAEKILTNETNLQAKEKGEDWVHHLDLFYLGITKFEQKKYKEAINVFNNALKLYPNFSEVLYYKGICLEKLDKKEEALQWIEEAKKYGKKGYTINEANAIYEKYPYQIRWQLWNE